MRTEWTQRLVAWARMRSAQYRSVQGEATLESLHRFRWFLLLVIPLHLVFAWQFSQYSAPQGHPELADWAGTISADHVLMLWVVVILGALVEWQLRRPVSNRLAYGLQLAVAIAYLVLGAALSLADVRVGARAGVGSYLLISIVISVMSLLRPGAAVPVFFGIYLFFNHALMELGLSPAQHASVQLLTLSVPVLSSAVSFMMWRQYVKTVLVQRQLSARNAELMYLAQHDPLTGLYNRRHFTQEAAAELARAARAQLPTSMLIADIDFFKKINDRYGHPAGDLVLKQVAYLLTTAVRGTDVVARLGGEEFIVLMPNTTRSGAMALAQKLCSSLEQHPLKIPPHQVSVTLSAGVSELAAGQAGSFEELYAAADLALYDAKAQGRNRVEWGVFTPHAPADSQGDFA